MRFAFGENWRAFALQALNSERVEQGRRDFLELLKGIELKGRSFLDIGFGQGLALFYATEAGAQVFGVDIDPVNEDALEHTRRFFPRCSKPDTRTASILDAKLVENLRQRGGFDIVYSWGALHHTGNMWMALDHSLALVRPEGYFVVALYNKHWTSRLWWFERRFFNSSPPWARRVIVTALYPVIYLAKWCVTGKNPMKKDRGMDFFYDVIDWLGGYPYEYASAQRVTDYMAARGWVRQRLCAARVPTGCNEYVFRRGSQETPG